MVEGLVIVIALICTGVLAYKLVQSLDKLADAMARSRNPELERELISALVRLKIHIPPLAQALYDLAERTNLPPQDSPVDMPEEEDNSLSDINRRKLELIEHHQAGVIPTYQFVDELRKLEAEE